MAAEALPPPAWLRLWAGAMPVLMPFALGGAVAFLPWEAGGAAVRAAAALAAAGAGVWLGLAYLRAVRRGRRPAMWATFIAAGFFTWTGVAQVGPALPEPGPLLAAVWLTAWVGAFLAQAWRF